ncbi:polysaccharide deacetylase [Catenulispora acidiphila DSM 44928]|uniref:Polysaccharide deacetylase n=1 Tax=Catenulispora acidiphila (strain DSM 44928 / JCM 14897 / NBRC 102108 / NRRL B-24433 / ID139908) TaxID=479433 RepID=C7PY28_CATAD|nr:polysaccharide deacetylase [Catenulispora acidiphila DSM 44928]
MLLGGCASTGKPVAVRPAGATTPTAGGSPRSRPTTGGAPFPGQSPASPGTSPAGGDTSTAPGDSHSNGSAPPDSSPPPSATGQDPPPPAGHPQFYVHEGDKAIALTIDDGPSSKYTPQVLALLAQYKIPATFCMIGQNAAQHASLVAEVSAAGHLVANHTWTHPNLAKMSEAQVTAEIERTNDAITKGGARQPVLFRAPGGNWSPTVFSVCAKLGLRALDWSVDPRDWSRPGTDHIVQTVMGHTHTGSIILEHDGGGDRSQTVAALQRFLPQLLEAGYKFVQP